MMEPGKDLPRRSLQLYDPEKQALFSAMTAADRLAWLDEIRLLYWEAQAARISRPARP